MTIYMPALPIGWHLDHGFASTLQAVETLVAAQANSAT
jgi:hypothetical protein